MDSFVLDAQASEIRSELLKERKRRFELEARLRTLEQRLGNGSLANSTDQTDSKRPLVSSERVASDVALSPAHSLKPHPIHEITVSRPRSSSEIIDKRRNRDESPSPRGKLNLEAERDWFTSLKVPESSNLASSGFSTNESSGSLEFSRHTMGSTEGAVAGDDERDSDTTTPEESDPNFGPSLNNSNSLRSRFASVGSAMGDSSPTLSRFMDPHSSMHSYGSGWSGSELNGTIHGNSNSLAASTNTTGGQRRRFDESAVRVSQLKIELSQYKQLLSDIGAQMKTLKSRCEYLEAVVTESEERNVLLRTQVREKNKQIIALQAELGSSESLKNSLDAVSKEKVSLQVELGVSRRAHAATSESEENWKKQCEKLQTALTTKEAEISTKDEMMAKMAEKLVQLKLQLQAIVPHLCKFSVSTTGRFSKSVVVSIGVLKPLASTSAAQLTPSSSHHSRELEIVTSGKRITHPASFVVSIAPLATHKERFSVTYRNGNTDTFETPKRDEIVASLNANLFGAGLDNDNDISTA